MSRSDILKISGVTPYAGLTPVIPPAARCGGPDAIRRILTLLTTMFCRLLMAILIC
jgi:hypothetical protein